jgi:DNA-binding NtrC family response regulator
MRQLFASLEQVVASDSTVLITGALGTGKTLVARTLHDLAPPPHGRLVSVNCADEPGELAPRLGLDSGQAHEPHPEDFCTVVLENVAATPMHLQKGLVDVLESRRRRPADPIRTTTRGTRFVATTSQPLEPQIARGMLREDLYRNLAEVLLVLPPLRERPEDIPLLAAHFLERAQRSRPPANRLTLRPADVRLLVAHDWPGNVRELRTVLELAVGRENAVTGASVDSAWLPTLGPLEFEGGRSYREVRGEFERDFEQRYVAWLLRRHRGNVSAAAREARMDRKHLYDLARRHGMRAGPSTRPRGR